MNCEAKFNIVLFKSIRKLKLWIKKRKSSGAFKRKQRQERKNNTQKLPKIEKSFSQPSLSNSEQNISINSDSNNVVTGVLVKKPTEKKI